MVRKISKDKYVIAFILTLGIFLLGMLFGFVIEGKRINFAQNEARLQKIDFSSLQLQYQYINQLSEEGDCEALIDAFDASLKNLDSTRVRIEDYEEDTKMNKEEFEVLKREYTISQLNYWLFAEKTKNMCNPDVTTILYFYDEKDKCPSCEEQAFVLTHLKKKFKEKLLIFALDSRQENEPMIKFLKKRYNVVSFPTLVIEDRVFTEVLSQDDILVEICPNYSDDVEECKDYYMVLQEVKNSTIEK